MDRFTDHLAKTEAGFAAVPEAFNVVKALKYQILETEKRLADQKELLELLEKNKDFERLLNLSRRLL